MIPRRPLPTDDKAHRALARPVSFPDPQHGHWRDHRLLKSLELVVGVGYRAQAEANWPSWSSTSAPIL